MARTEKRKVPYLQEWMTLRGVTPKDLDSDGVVSYSTFYRIVGGESYFRSSLVAIANRLGVKVEQLFERPDAAKVSTLRNLLSDPEALLDEDIRLPKYLREKINNAVIDWLHEQSSKDWKERLEDGKPKRAVLPKRQIGSSAKS